MKIAYFTHSLRSCWNHGNAHFLRGVLRELVRRGHDVEVFEPEGAWSLANLLADHGEEGLRPYFEAYPELGSHIYGPGLDLELACGGADLVIVHEWNDPEITAGLGRLRRSGAGFTLLFHDTHHRAVSDPEALKPRALEDYDGILAFGEALARVYRRWGWGERAFVWHEAADVGLFRPPAQEGARQGVVFIGNWGDDERTGELEAFLFAPVRRAGLELDVHGVRYPAEGRGMLERYGARYRGWLPNARAPEVFARHLATAHVPRRFYAQILPGIPTIRVFEALACGIPLVSAPWDDAEGLFRPGRDYLIARSGDEMERHLQTLARDADLRAELAMSGLETVRARHTCAHRVDELLAIAARLGARAALEEMA